MHTTLHGEGLEGSESADSLAAKSLANRSTEGHSHSLPPHEEHLERAALPTPHMALRRIQTSTLPQDARLALADLARPVLNALAKPPSAHLIGQPRTIPRLLLWKHWRHLWPARPRRTSSTSRSTGPGLGHKFLGPQKEDFTSCFSLQLFASTREPR